MNRFRTWITLILLFSVTSILVVTLALYYLDQERKGILSTIHIQNDSHIEKVDTALRDDWHHILSDLLFMAQHPLLVDSLVGLTRGGKDESDPVSGKPGENGRDCYGLHCIEKIFTSFLVNKMIYHKARIIGVDGKELLTVRFKNGEISSAVVQVKEVSRYHPKHRQLELQEKRQRIYFQKTISLSAGEVYVSPFDLNVENGEIEMPHLPTIRFSTPLFDQNARRLGILVLSYDGRYILEKIKDFSKGGLDISLLNQAGFWLYRPDGRHTFDFLRSENQSSFAKSRPQVWSVIEHAQEGAMETDDGYYFYREFRPFQSSDASFPGLDLVLNKKDKSQDAINLSHYAWKIVLFTPRESIERLLEGFRTTVTIGVCSFEFLFLIVLTILYFFFRKRQVASEEAEREVFAQRVFHDLQFLSVKEMELVPKLEQFLETLLSIPWLQSVAGAAILLPRVSFSQAPRLIWRYRDHTGENTPCPDIHAPDCPWQRLLQNIPESGNSPELDQAQWEEGFLSFTARSLQKVEAILAISDQDPASRARLLDSRINAYLANSAQLLADLLVRHHGQEEILKFQRAVQQSPASVVITDLGGRIEFVNDKFTEVTGYTLDEVLGQNPRLLKSEITPVSLYREMWGNLQSGREWRGELCNRRKDGTLFWEVALISPIRNQEGQATHYLAVKEDITQKMREAEERRDLENQLRQAQKMEAIGHLTGGIAHDFNNILAAVKGFTELAMVRFAKDETSKLHQYLRHVLTASDRARDLISQMLTFSRTREQEMRRVTLEPMVKEVVKLLRATLPTSISITLKFGRKNMETMVDPVQLHQVIMNLCINARDAMQGKGQLDIRVYDEEQGENRHCSSCHNTFYSGSLVVLSIRDNGVGIPQDVLNKIFDPFFTTKDVGQGTGMGLSVVHGIMHAINGHVVVESKPNIGTEFLLYFQPCISHEEHAALIPRVVNKECHMKGTVLLVDDEASIVEFLKEVMEEEGLSVVTYTRSVEALDFFEKDPRRIDLLITDQTMPDLSGIEMIKRMHALRSDLPVILCTGFSKEVNEGNAANFGIGAFLKKPIALGAFREALQKTLGSGEPQ